MSRLIDHGKRLHDLWIAYLLAMLFHVELGLMPLFHGHSAQIESTVDPSRLSLVFWGMLIYFLIPLACLLLITYAAGDDEHGRRWRPWKWNHYWISIVYTVTNLVHLIADIVIPDSRSDQVFLMVVLLLIGFLINREAWRWLRQSLPPATTPTVQTDNP
ncbi:MAG: hypothetical protein WAM11_06700 [Cyanobium sp.]